MLGTCDRKRVGAVIVRDGRCVTWGYNGAPPGLPHCSENSHGWFGSREIIEFVHPGEVRPVDQTEEEQELLYQQFLHLHGCRNATHAEANALAFAARQGISTDGGTLYVTLSPCDVCARLTIAAGIVAVYFGEEYRDPAGRELLEQALIPCHHISLT